MTPQDVQRFNERLQSHLPQKRIYEEEALSVLAEPGDVGDIAVAIAEQHLIAKLTERDYKKTMEIKEAQVRLQDNSYGICLVCSHPIGEKRLEAVPWAKYCIRCQQIIGELTSRGAEESLVVERLQKKFSS